MPQSERGRFIVFEGIDGSGKSTQIKLLCDRLKAAGRKVYLTAEPTSSVTGGLLRDALSGVAKRTGYELAALFLLDRINHNVNPVNGIEVMLERGYDVICDRYYYSSLAYQGSEVDFEWVKNMNLNCREIRMPDACIFLDLDPDSAMERIGSDRAVTEIYEKKSKLESIRNKYFSLFSCLDEKENIKIVDATKSIDEIAQKIFDEIGKI